MIKGHSSNLDGTLNPSNQNIFSRRKFVLTSFIAATVGKIPPFQSVVETYPSVEGENISLEYIVTVNDQVVPVYTAPIDPSYNPKSGQQWDTTYSFATFEFS